MPCLERTKPSGLSERGQNAEQYSAGRVDVQGFLPIRPLENDPGDPAQRKRDARHLEDVQGLAQKEPGFENPEDGGQAGKQRADARADREVGLEQEKIAERQADHARKQEPAPTVRARAEGQGLSEQDEIQDDEINKARTRRVSDW